MMNKHHNGPVVTPESTIVDCGWRMNYMYDSTENRMNSVPLYIATASKTISIDIYIHRIFIVLDNFRAFSDLEQKRTPT